MTPGLVSKRVVAGRLAMIKELLEQVRTLPLRNREEFVPDPRNYAIAESCLRRSLEALLDIGRHILAKGYGVAVPDYQQIAVALRERGALTDKEAELLKTLAGYRNRMVHFYDEVSAEELFDICAHELSDIELVGDAYRRWLEQHPDRVEPR